MFLKTGMLHVCLHCIQHVTEKEEQWLNITMCLYYSVYSRPGEEKKKSGRITNIHRLLFKQTESSKTAALLPQTPRTFNWHPRIKTVLQTNTASAGRAAHHLCLPCPVTGRPIRCSSPPALPSPFLPLTSFCHLRFPSSPLRVLL